MSSKIFKTFLISVYDLVCLLVIFYFVIVYFFSYGMKYVFPSKWTLVDANRLISQSTTKKNTKPWLLIKAYLVPGCGLNAAMTGWIQVHMIEAAPTAAWGLERSEWKGSRPSAANITMKLVIVRVKVETMKPWWRKNQRSFPQGFTEDWKK